MTFHGCHDGGVNDIIVQQESFLPNLCGLLSGGEVHVHHSNFVLLIARRVTELMRKHITDEILTVSSNMLEVPVV